jgi:hypothetical protein
MAGFFADTTDIVPRSSSPFSMRVRGSAFSLSIAELAKTRSLLHHNSFKPN